MENKIYVNTKKQLFPVAKDLYGLFFEDINRAGDGGLYPEMIRNRSFEDSLIPDGCTVDEKKMVYKNKAGWPGAFNHGEGMDDWAKAVPETPIPGWYTEKAQMELESKDTLNSNRKAALRINYEPGGKCYNIGYAGIPLKRNDVYQLCLFLKADTEFDIKVILEGGRGEEYGSSIIHVTSEKAWQKFDTEIAATENTEHNEDFEGKIIFQADRSCSVLFGFVSLMPKDTFMGHGLRTDLCMMLKNLHPRFLRFPGGCVVEGLTQETAMRFSHTIGPVWERPSHNLMWHYRTTNGLGFHEYLQLCEDLGIEAMYVCNCGISCQARRGESYDETGTEEMLNEAFNALEYALGDTTTTYGAKRAAAGHPEPFTMKYMEIGNENWGEEYNKRYALFYKKLKEKYPKVIFISNGHTEAAGLPTEYVDEHYYSTPEYFMENDGKFDDYDRKGPKIFLGEYAVNGGNTIASMECALAEAVFLTGVEKNQDLVKLSAYAPLFQNADYTAWKPNLIVFDNHQVYGIPSYHVISLMGKYRGKDVVETKVEGEYRAPYYKGVPGVMCEKPGMEMKNPKINGKSIDISRVIYGTVKQTEENGIYTMEQGGKKHPFTGKSKEWNEAFEHFIRGDRHNDERDTMWVTFGTEDMEEYVFEVDLKFDSDNSVTLSSWNFHPDTDAGCNEPKDYDWNLGSVRNQIWKIQNGTGVTEVRGFLDFGKPEPEKTSLEIDYSVFNTYKIVAGHEGYQCYINDTLVQEKKHALHPLVYAVSTIEDDRLIIKVINVADTEKTVHISMDCNIYEDIEVETIAAPLDSVNSFDNKENVSAEKTACKSKDNAVAFSAKPYSLNILCAKMYTK